MSLIKPYLMNIANLRKFGSMYYKRVGIIITKRAMVYKLTLEAPAGDV